MKYASTRGNVAGIGFIDAFMMGLANDGGLLIPEQIPQVSVAQLEQWRTLEYTELVQAIFELYVDGEIPSGELKQLIESSYATFRTPEVTPVQQLKDDLYLLELFHGPTFAFKDVALQFMGQLYSYVATKTGQKINILGATSGDTGASAIAGLRGKEGIKICILHPEGKVSRVQELQMTTVLDDNVLNLSVEGNFDDCQRMIKELFSDIDFKNKHQLAAINSINFIRIMAQTVYYFYAYFRITEPGSTKKINFSVPTGNFGDIFAGYLAKRMGLPIHKLILATNENNILERFINQGVYKPDQFKMTYSPSMDIQVASNFERYLYYVTGENTEQVKSFMQQFAEKGEIVIDSAMLAIVQAEFSAYGVAGELCLQTISKYNEETNYLLDPHSACGVAAAEQCAGQAEITVSLATAHPAKFDEAISLCGIKQTFPDAIAELSNKQQRQTKVDGDLAAITDELITFYG
ncbi:threonine synthase [Paenibacillus yanchengensis]|uniref:Threonine synthase n=1 Tax=Paenibacillus yanchengensis TaxID=2035833 RepID=A0ABW4YM23_9BACL